MWRSRLLICECSGQKGPISRHNWAVQGRFGANHPVYSANGPNWVRKVGDDSTVHEFVAKYMPDMVLLVLPLSNERKAEILAYLQDSPRTPCLVLTNTTRHLEQARAAGADVALLAGFPTHELFASVKRLLFT